MRVPKLILSFIALVVSSTLPAHATNVTYDQLDQINWSVNLNKYVRGVYDCKQYAWDKQIILRDQYNKPSLWIAVRTETGNYHAILVVDDKWALDNRRKRVVTVAELRRDGYYIAKLKGEQDE